MLDIKICDEGDFDGDLQLTDDGDITLEDNVLQNACISILWISGEWRFGPDIGLPWFDDILLKSPSTDLIQQEIRDALLSVDGVQDATIDLISYNQKERSLRFRFSIEANGKTYSKEVAVGE